MRHALASIVLALAVSASAGCTTTETDPSKVSMGDLLFGGNRLRSHLDERYAALDGLMDRSAALSLRLDDRRRALRKLDQDFEREARTGQDLDVEQDALRDEAAVRQRELDGTNAEVQSLRDELALLREESTASRAENAALTERIRQHEAEIESLEGEVVVLERAIDRILTVRTRHALETS